MTSSIVAALSTAAPLAGKTALVTGAGTGMGRSVTRALIAAGARVTLVGRTRSTLERTTELAAGEPERLLICVADISDEEAIRAAIVDTVARWGRLDILVNNAGTNIPVRSVADTSIADWQRVIDINLSGVYYAVRAALPYMREQGSGNIINIASMAARQASIISGASYSASKHGVLSLTHSINLEEWRHGIRSSCVMPGEVDTPIMDLRAAPPTTSERALMLQAEDIGDVVLFLATLPERVLIEELTIRPRVRRPMS